jgi:hypothetical protein
VDWLNAAAESSPLNPKAQPIRAAALTPIAPNVMFHFRSILPKISTARLNFQQRPS